MLVYFIVKVKIFLINLEIVGSMNGREFLVLAPLLMCMRVSCINSIIHVLMRSLSVVYVNEYPLS